MKIYPAMHLLLAAVAMAQPAPSNIARLEVPGLNGVLQLDVGATPWSLDFDVQARTTMLRAEDRSDGVITTAVLHRIDGPATSASCRDTMWPEQRAGYGTRLAELQQETNGGRAQITFVFQGTNNNNSRHQLRYWGSRDLCAEVHLSKAGFTSADQARFDQVLSTVKLLPNENGLRTPGSPESSSLLFAQGSELHARGDFASAVAAYQRAMSMEMARPSFDDEMFEDLVGGLAFAERMSNKPLPEQQEVLQKGLRRLPESPILHYQLACVFAAMEKPDLALEQLRLMYQHRDKAGNHRLPDDPLEDDCFRNVAQDKKFVDAVRAMGRP